MKKDPDVNPTSGAPGVARADGLPAKPRFTFIRRYRSIGKPQLPFGAQYKMGIEIQVQFCEINVCKINGARL